MALGLSPTLSGPTQEVRRGAQKLNLGHVLILKWGGPLPSLKDWSTNDGTVKSQFKQQIRQKKGNRKKKCDRKTGKYISKDFYKLDMSNLGL